MTWVTTGLGTVLVALALADLLATTVSVAHGAGPVAGGIARATWGLLSQVRRRLGRSRLLVAGGPLILILVIAAWAVLLIIGWSLVFGQSERLLTVQDGTPVPVLGRMRYAASIVIGRGSTAVQPAGGVYEVLEPVAAATGLATLSLSIAYVLPVVRGVVAKRSLALYVSALGRTPADVLRRAWNGRDLGQLDLHLIDLTPRIAAIAQSHLAYPVIHYFHSAERSTALGPSLVALDEALTAHRLVERPARLDPTATEPLRAVIDDFLDTLRLAFIKPADLEVAVGDDRMSETTSQLSEHGLPLDQDARHEFSEEEVARNRLLRGYLAHDGWGDSDALDVGSGTS